MSSRCRRALILAVAAAVWGQPSAAAALPDELTFCVGQGNLPLSGNARGIELEIARALAGRLGVKPRFEWLHPQMESFEEAVATGRCDAAMGLIADPGPLAGDRTLPGVVLTEPYYDAAYLVIRRPDTPPLRDLDELGPRRIATEATSIAVFTLRQRGKSIAVLDRHESVVDAVAEGREAYGYLWGPIAARLLSGRDDVVIDPVFEPVDRWSFAIGLGAAASERRLDLNAALMQLKGSGKIAEIFEAHRLPYLAPCGWPVSAAAAGRLRPSRAPC